MLRGKGIAQHIENMLSVPGCCIDCGIFPTMKLFAPVVSIFPLQQWILFIGHYDAGFYISMSIFPITFMFLNQPSSGLIITRHLPHYQLENIPAEEGKYAAKRRFVTLREVLPSQMGVWHLGCKASGQSKHNSMGVFSRSPTKALWRWRRRQPDPTGNQKLAEADC